MSAFFGHLASMGYIHFKSEKYSDLILPLPFMQSLGDLSMHIIEELLDILPCTCTCVAVEIMNVGTRWPFSALSLQDRLGYLERKIKIIVHLMNPESSASMKIRLFLEHFYPHMCAVAHQYRVLLFMVKNAKKSVEILSILFPHMNKEQMQWFRALCFAFDESVHSPLLNEVDVDDCLQAESSTSFCMAKLEELAEKDAIDVMQGEVENKWMQNFDSHLLGD